MFEPSTRSGQANARMWVMLADLARDVVWHGQKLTKEEWKDATTAAIKRQRVIPGIEGGWVVLGSSTKRMTVAEMNELMQFIEYFGADQGVKFSADPSMTEPA